MRKLALLLLVAPLVLAACGGSSSSVKVDPVAYVRHAARVTAGTPSEHMTMRGKVGVGAMSISMGGSGDFSNSQHTGSFAMHLSILGKSEKITEVLAGTTIYMTSPLFAKSLPSGKTWLKLDLQKLGKQEGIDLSSLMSRSPTQALQQLETAGTVTQVGTTTIDGAATTEFQLKNFDISKLPQGAKIQALAHPKYGPIDVWIGDSNGYVYRETMSFTYTAAGQSATMSMDVNLSKFGEAVHVTVPKPSETVDSSSMLGGGLGG